MRFKPTTNHQIYLFEVRSAIDVDVALLEWTSNLEHSVDRQLTAGLVIQRVYRQPLKKLRLGQ